MHKSTRILLIILNLFCFTACNEQTSPADTSSVTGAAQQAEAAHPSNPTSGDLQDGGQNNADTHSTVKNVLIFGDSITAGYGLDPEQAFPALLQEKVDSLGWQFNIINGGLSGDTSAGGLRRINWMLREPPAVLVLELGGNDGLRGTSPEATKTNLQAIIDEVKASNPDVEIIIAGMQIPPNLGQDYTRAFRNVFPSLADENSAHLIPFLLENVGGVPSLNQPDGIHPTAKGHKIVAENVWEVLNPILSSMVQ